MWGIDHIVEHSGDLLQIFGMIDAVLLREAQLLQERLGIDMFECHPCILTGVGEIGGKVMDTVALKEDHTARIYRHAVNPCLSRQDDMQAVAVSDTVDDPVSVGTAGAEAEGAEHEVGRFFVGIHDRIVFKVVVPMVEQHRRIVVLRRPGIVITVLPETRHISHGISFLSRVRTCISEPSRERL